MLALSGERLVVPINGRLSAAAALALLLCSGQAAVAGDYVVEISGASGTHFAGTCLLMHGKTYEKRETTGTVPFTVDLSADLISCAIQKKGGSGDLLLVIRSVDGRIVDQSSSVQPFGVIMAAGR